jgi:putative Ca2+/H+ antiporter (TMEM165/GDT1 family)
MKNGLADDDILMPKRHPLCEQKRRILRARPVVRDIIYLDISLITCPALSFLENTMDWKIFGTAFLTLFLAELGDKTQLAVITMSARTESKVAVFLGASLALVLVSLLGVLVGGVLSQYIPTEWLQRIVAAAFIIIGVLMLLGKL